MPGGVQAPVIDGGPSPTELPLDRLIALRADEVRLASTLGGVTTLPGHARTLLRGRGFDFDEMRPYVEGDDVRHIDWNVTARTGRPHTRIYREERERAVTVAVDLRRSMFTGSARLKAVAAGEYAATLLWHVAANRDRAGALVFDDVEMAISRPAARQSGVLEALGVIARRFDVARTPRPGPSQSFVDLIAALNGLSRNAGVALLLTDCANPGADLDRELAIAGRRDRLVVLHLVDPLEQSGLPGGRYRFHAGGEPISVALDRQAAERLRQNLQQQLARIETQIADASVSYWRLSTDTPAGDVWLRLTEHGVL